jgi:hypothetical protein
LARATRGFTPGHSESCAGRSPPGVEPAPALSLRSPRALGARR